MKGQRIAALVEQRYRHEEALDAEAAALENQATAAEKSVNETAQMGQQIGQAFGGAFTELIQDLAKGKDGVEALKNSLMRLADQLLSMALNSIFKNLFGSIGLGFADGGEVPGFATGGFVSGRGGPRSDSIPAMLSDGEYVVNAAATKKFGPLLAAINSGKFGGFAAGGAVGSMPSMGGVGGGQNINFAPVINVESKATGDPVADEKAAQAMGRAIEQRMRHVVFSEIMQQQRSGGILNRRR